MQKVRSWKVHEMQDMQSKGACGAVAVCSVQMFRETRYRRCSSSRSCSGAVCNLQEVLEVKMCRRCKCAGVLRGVAGAEGAGAECAG